MKFQVGDRVRVATWADWRQQYRNLPPLQGKLCGEVVATVKHSYGDYVVDWDEDQFNLLNPNSDCNHADWKVFASEIEYADNLFAAP